jgi:methylated-DNA-protein-cysteine methyltransferase-like protein
MGYGHVASALANPGMARQVGWALAALPGDTDVPWQRVVRSSGHLAAQGAVDRAILQRGRLEAEGVVFSGGHEGALGSGRVDMETFGLPPEQFLGREW